MSVNFLLHNLYFNFTPAGTSASPCAGTSAAAAQGTSTFAMSGGGKKKNLTRRKKVCLKNEY
jgi:hypothetical protein